MTDTKTEPTVREDLPAGAELKNGSGETIVRGPEDLDLPIHRLIPKLIEALPLIEKKGTSPKSMGEYPFRRIEDLLDELKPLLPKFGVFYAPTVLERVAETRSTSNGTALYTVHLHVRFRFYGPRGDYLEVDTWGEGMDNFDKATNKAHTAAQKNALLELLNVASGEPDSEEGEYEKTVAPGRSAQQGTSGGRRSSGGRKKPPEPPESPLKALGWKDVDEGNRLHQQIGERIQAFEDADRELVKSFRDEAKIPWPMGPDDWNKLDDFVRTLEPGPEGDGSAEDTSPPEGEPEG